VESNLEKMKTFVVESRFFRELRTAVPGVPSAERTRMCACQGFRAEAIAFANEMKNC
jgi:hypothetical protein